MIKGFIFDLDGVLVDTAQYHFQAWKKLAAELGFELSEKRNEELKGVSRRESLEKILQWGNISLSENDILEHMQRKNEWYLELIKQVKPDDYLPGAKKFLQEARKLKLKIGLGSASKNARPILDNLSFTPYFDALIDGNSITRSKPDPQVFELGAREMDLEPGCIVVFEDAIAGIEAALKGGFKAVGIGSPKVLKKAHLCAPSLAHFTPAEVLNQLNLKKV